MPKTPRNSYSKPSAWIVNSTDKGRKSIKSGRVYLKNEEEFQIELFNPLTDCVLADIKLNGSSISKNGLVIKPGQRFYLDCFVDEGKKFVFKTYEVEDSQEAKDAISQNGMLEVFFYKESVVSVSNWKRKFDRVIVERYYPAYYPAYQPYYPYGIPNVYFGTATTNRGTIAANTSTSKAQLNLNAGQTFTNTSNMAFAGTTTNNVYVTQTGRAERGTASSQRFEEPDMEFESFYISSTILQLLPESAKPAEAKDLIAKQKEAKSGAEAIELIKKLADLRDAGIITDEEFRLKKAELLSRI